MKTNPQSHTKTDQTNGLVQTGLVLVWVQCKGYRCMAYSDATGEWINFYTGQKITDFIEVVG
jgi:hypothetical protein